MTASNDVLHSRILIVDDQDSNVRLLEYTLRRGGFLAVTSTTDPLEVCALHRQHSYDLIILDLQMPRMSGFEVIESLRQAGPVAILVITADPAQMVRALEAGARGFISKPFVLSEVQQRVRLMLEKPVADEAGEPSVAPRGDSDGDSRPSGSGGSRPPRQVRLETRW